MTTKTQEQQEKKREFGKIRSVIFPIHKDELKKFIPLSLIFFLISINYSALRNLKDILIIDEAGAEAIYYIKLIGVLPVVILYTIIYGKISRIFNRNGRFNGIIIYFLIFYIIFLFFLMPNLEALKLNVFADKFNENSPAFKGLWEAIRNWPLTFFYINAEAWGTFCLSVLFWTFANEITSVKQSKRFYSFLAIGANIGLIVAGSFLKTFGKNIDMMIGFVVIMGIALLIIYNMFSKKIEENPEQYQIEIKPKKKKIKMSFKESFNFLAKSKYLALIAVLVISYGMFISLFESVWKSQIKKLLVETAGDKGLLANIYANQSILTGIVTIVLIIFLSAPIMRKGWRFAASATPVVGAILSFLFFLFIAFGEKFQGIADFFSTTSLSIAVTFGLINVVFIKAAKYTLFDPTKESTYIPLDEELKVRGKGAVDGVGARLGKSLGSVILTIWLVPMIGGGEIDNVKHYVIIFIAAIIIAWLIAVKKLGLLFEKHNTETKASDTKK